MSQQKVTQEIPDYYAVLGVPSDASRKEIQKAYRKLAKTHHPDIESNGNVDFSEITRAYDILHDPIKREKYDLNLLRTEEIGNNYNFFTNLIQHHFDHRPSLKIVLQISIKDAVLGRDFKISAKVPQGDPGEETTVTLNVTVPPGTQDCQELVINEPLEFKEYKDAVILISVLPDDQYSLEGDKIIYKVKVSTMDLITGINKRVPVFGRWSTLEIPSGTSPYEEFSVTNDHYPGVIITAAIEAKTPSLYSARKALENLEY